MANFWEIESISFDGLVRICKMLNSEISDVFEIFNDK